MELNAANARVKEALEERNRVMQVLQEVGKFVSEVLGEGECGSLESLLNRIEVLRSRHSRNMHTIDELTK